MDQGIRSARRKFKSENRVTFSRLGVGLRFNKSTVDKRTKQVRIGLISLVIVVLHSAMALYVLFAPAQFQSRSKIARVYRQTVVLGPFFTASRIKQSHYLSFRYKKNDTWSEYRELAKEHFLAYCTSPWRIDKLSYIGYERYLANAIGEQAGHWSFEKLKNASSFRELNAFLTHEVIKMPVDSIRIACGLDNYNPRTKSYLLDTVFVFTYNPTSIAKAKR